MLLGLLGLVFDSRKAAPGDENLCRYFGPPKHTVHIPRRRRERWQFVQRLAYKDNSSANALQLPPMRTFSWKTKSPKANPEPQDTPETLH